MPLLALALFDRPRRFWRGAYQLLAFASFLDGGSDRERTPLYKVQIRRKLERDLLGFGGTGRLKDEDLRESRQVSEAIRIVAPDQATGTPTSRTI